VSSIAFLVIKSFLHCYDAVNWLIGHFFEVEQSTIHFLSIVNWNRLWISGMLMSIQLWSNRNNFFNVRCIKIKVIRPNQMISTIVTVSYLICAANCITQCRVLIVNSESIDYLCIMIVFVGLMKDLISMNGDFSTYLDFTFNYLKERSKSS
jgi:hypothetical protein